MTDARTQGCSQVLRGPVLTPRTFPGALVQAAPQDCCPNFHPPLPVFQVVEGDFDSFDTIAILTLHRYWLFPNHTKTVSLSQILSPDQNAVELTASKLQSYRKAPSFGSGCDSRLALASKLADFGGLT